MSEQRFSTRQIEYVVKEITPSIPEILEVLKQKSVGYSESELEAMAPEFTSFTVVGAYEDGVLTGLGLVNFVDAGLSVVKGQKVVFGGESE